MSTSLRIAYGEALAEAAAKNDNIVVLDADLSHATMTNIFQKSFPERFYNMGIAEGNLMLAAAGFAHTGLIPFVSTFAIFGAGRAYEQIRNSICYTNANVKLALTHAGLSVGEDGGSHQAIEDIALMRVLPNMTILVPCDPIETKKCIKAAVEIDGPVYIRIARPVCNNITTEDTPFVPGKANVLLEGEDVCIITAGLMTPIALDAAKILNNQNISTSVVNMHTIKPLDKDIVLAMAKKCKAIVTVEEHSVIGGLGSAVAEVLAGTGDTKFAMVGIQDKFGKSGDPAGLFEEYGLTKENVARTCKSLL